VSLTLEIKMDDLLAHFPAGRQALAIWAFRVVPSDMSLGMRLVVISDETQDSDGPESMAVGLSVPLG